MKQLVDTELFRKSTQISGINRPYLIGESVTITPNTKLYQFVSQLYQKMPMARIAETSSKGVYQIRIPGHILEASHWELRPTKLALSNIFMPIWYVRPNTNVSLIPSGHRTRVVGFNSSYVVTDDCLKVNPRTPVEILLESSDSALLESYLR